MRYAVLVTALLLATGCAAEPTDPAESSPSDRSWRNSDDPISTEGLTWASGTAVHLREGTVDTGIPVGSYVIAGDGVYFYEAEDPGDDFDYGGTAPLLYADRDGEVSETGVEVLADTLSASPNGRYLAALDMGSGEEDDFGTVQAEVVVWDLETGEEIIRATDAMGDPAEDDFAAAYPEAELDIPLLTDDTLYVEGLGDTWSYDLATGNGEALPDDQEVPAYDPLSLESPGGSWALSDRGHGQLLLGPGGTKVVPKADTTRLELYGWVDGQTTYGVLGGAQARLMTCTVPSGECSELAGTAGKRVVFPLERLGTGSIDLAELSR